MELAALIVNFGLLALTGAAAVAAVVQARVAQRAQEAAESAQAKAELARDDARRLSKEANAAFIRQAEAQERANEIALARQPADGASWTIQHLDGVRYIMRNVGNRTAEKLTVHEMSEPSGFLRHDYSTPVDVPPNDVIELTVLSAWGSPNVKVQLRWTEGDGPLKTDDTTIVV